jgi:tetratricopeptide (TPR) repeat protein
LSVTRDELTRMIEQQTAALKANPRQAEGLVRRGMAYYLLGDHTAAVADFTAALEIQPAFPEGYNNRGVARHALGDYAAAVADFDEALRLRPGYVEAYNNRGVTRTAQGDAAGAVADHDAAIRLQPAYAEAYNNRGAARQALRDLPGALADYDMALRLNPNYAEAYDNRGTVHYLLWQHARAVADFNRALSLYKGTPVTNAALCRLYICRGDALYHDGNAAGLFADYRRAYQLDPDQAARLIVERLARDIAVNHQLVLANCDKHLKANPDDAIAYARRGLVHLLTGNDADARQDIDRFYQKHPHNPLGLLRALIEKAHLHRQEHGAVVPGDTPGFRPPQMS